MNCFTEESQQSSLLQEYLSVIPQFSVDLPRLYSQKNWNFASSKYAAFLEISYFSLNMLLICLPETKTQLSFEYYQNKCSFTITSVTFAVLAYF